MKKTTKGALAAGGAAALLLGGASTLAYWSAEGDVEGGTFTSGELKLLNEDCDGAGAGEGSGWFFDGGESAPSKEYVAGDLVVPGDVLTKTCTYEIQATGEHLRAGLATTGATTSGALASSLAPTASFTVAGETTTSITDTNDGDVLTATISVEFDGGADNSTQNLAAVLSSYVVTATQIHD
ncbi:alternate-type signal peptide domain-containing protein [Nocardioides silvaticus]|nr:alternate-type signal peptide domain-containing protein [Nocardioides silvaticus]